MLNLTWGILQVMRAKEGKLATLKGFILRMKGMIMSPPREASRRMTSEGTSMKSNKLGICMITRLITVHRLSLGETRIRVTDMGIRQAATRMKKSLQERKLESTREREGITKNLWESSMPITETSLLRCPWTPKETASHPPMMLNTKISKLMSLMQEAIVTPCTQAGQTHQDRPNLPTLSTRKITGWSILEEMKTSRPG